MSFTKVNDVLVKHYPQDPQPAILDVIAYIEGPNRDLKKLIHDVYDLVGYGLYLAFGPSPDAEAFHADLSKIVTAAAANPQALPPWLLPLLLQVLQFLSNVFIKK